MFMSNCINWCQIMRKMWHLMSNYLSWFDMVWHEFACFDILLIGKRKGITKNTFTTKIDTEAQKIHPSRQSNRVSAIPLSFNSARGVTNLPKVKAQEYPSIILLYMVLLGMKSLYLPQAQTRQVQYALVGLYLMWIVLKRTFYVRKEVKKMPHLINR